MAYLPIDLMTSEKRVDRRLKTSNLNSFDGAGASGFAFARTIPITVPPGGTYGVKIQKNANTAVRFVRAQGLYIEAVRGDVSGSITALEGLISTNGIQATDFAGSIEVYDSPSSGDVVLGRQDELNDSFYPDGEFCIDLVNSTNETVNTFFSLGVEQITGAGVYTILEPNTQLEADTEMSNYNGVN